MVNVKVIVDVRQKQIIAKECLKTKNLTDNPFNN